MELKQSQVPVSWSKISGFILGESCVSFQSLCSINTLVRNFDYLVSIFPSVTAESVPTKDGRKIPEIHSNSFVENKQITPLIKIKKTNRTQNIT